MGVGMSLDVAVLAVFRAKSAFTGRWTVSGTCVHHHGARADWMPPGSRGVPLGVELSRRATHYC